MGITTRNGLSDFSVFAEKEENGQLLTLGTIGSVENAFRMWLVSQRGEIPRAPSKGGFLVQWLNKPLTPENGEELRATIIEGLEIDFYPNIRVERLSVEPNYRGKYWEIHLIGLVPEFKERIDTFARIRSTA